jgi:23S rRNA pseudouridine1911/1915/1917 synthase
MTAEFREIRLRIASHEAEMRLDRYLARQVAGISRTRIQTLMGAGLITIGGIPVKPSRPVKNNDEVVIRIPGLEPSPLTPEDIPLDIRYEDQYLMVVEKPAGLVVHPAHGHPSGTLINGLLYHLSPQPPLIRGVSPHGEEYPPCIRGGRGEFTEMVPPLSRGGGGDFLTGGSAAIIRPALVHRIDKDTSGLLVVAKDELTLTGLAIQFKEKTAERKYRALVWGQLKPAEGRIEAPLGRSKKDRKLFGVVDGGKESATRYRTLERFELLSLLELQLETGRTHQIRIHMHHAGHPVFGDPQYGGRNRRMGPLTTVQRAFVAKLLEILPRQALHAGVLGFVHPSTGEFLRFESEFPEDIAAVLKLLQST